MVKVLVTGTPGTGKTTLARALVQLEPRLTMVNIGEEIANKGLHDGRDAEWEAFIINEDKVLDELEPLMSSEAHVVVDHHSCDWFPERWFDLVVVLRTTNDILYPRLESRGYNEKKINENIEAEIFQVVKDEAVESYKEDIVWELNSNTVEDMEENTERVLNFIRGKMH